MNYLSELQQAAECLHINDLPRAEQLYKQVLSFEPTNGHAYLGMGKIALQVEQYDKAVSILTKCCELLPQEISPLIQLSEAFNGVSSEKDALTVLEYANRQFPNHSLVLYRLGLQHLIVGDLEKAESAFSKVLALASNVITSFTLFELSRLGHHSDKITELLTSRFKQEALTNDERIVLHYAMGNVLDNQSHFKLAWSHFEQANVLQQQNCQFRTNDLVPFYQQIKTNATRQNLQVRLEKSETESPDDITPIFILGLPRTGSTLLEFLLTQHPDIASAGEVGYLGKDVDDFLYHSFGVRYPQSLVELSDHQMQQAAKVYLQKLATHANGRTFVIDKLPANFQSIGLIYKLFPNAKVLHMQRNIAPVAFSIFRNNFAQNEPYFCSLDEFKQYHQLYTDLMALWKSSCSNFIYDVSYEQLIDDKSTTIENVFMHCGLRSIKPKIADNPEPQSIKSLSNIQVRRAISAKSMNQWHNYAQQLKIFNDD